VKFKVERDVLGEAVAWVARALPSRPVVPVLSGLLLQAGEHGLTLSCFDYEVSARIVVDAEVAEPGTALVPGRLLAEITRSLPARPADFSSVGDMVGLTCGSAEFTLVSLPAQDYPALPEPPEPAGEVDGGVLAAAAAQVVPSASRDDTLPMLTGVCLDIDGPVMTLAATDRYRLAVREVHWDPAVPGMRAAALVPARTLADVARSMATGVPVTVAFGASAGERGEAGGVAHTAEAPGRATGEPRPAEGMISFEGGRRRLTARLIAGEFIRYRSRFPAEFSCRAELPAGQFIEAVRRVSLVAERASPVRLAFGTDEVVIEAQAEGRARAVESVAADFAGDERVISFNPHYLLDGLAAAAAPGAARAAAAPADGAEAPSAAPGRIRLEFTSPAKPALITWAGEETGEAASPEEASSKPASAGADHPDAEAGGARNDGTPTFRYLVVPLRVPVRT
jgi:DNA polymerase III subunit beta